MGHDVEWSTPGYIELHYGDWFIDQLRPYVGPGDTREHLRDQRARINPDAAVPAEIEPQDPLAKLRAGDRETARDRLCLFAHQLDAGVALPNTASLELRAISDLFAPAPTGRPPSLKTEMERDMVRRSFELGMAAEIDEGTLRKYGRSKAGYIRLMIHKQTGISEKRIEQYLSE